MANTKNVGSKNDRQIELYKKYRPQVWSDLIGQQDVARTFQNAISWVVSSPPMVCSVLVVVVRHLLHSSSPRLSTA